MLIDWFTVVAQIFNFLVLIWLLKRFLYGPITQAMAKREALIASQLADAQTSLTEAAQEAECYRQMQATLKDKHHDWLEQTRQQVEQQRQDWLDEAKQSVAIAREQWLKDLEQEHQQIWDTIHQQTTQQLVDTTRQVLIHLANVDLEEHIVQVFIHQLHHLSTQEQDRLHTAFTHSPDRHLTLRSSFPLSTAQSDRLRQALNDHIPEAIALEFATDPSLVCGIQLTTAGYLLDWNIAHYLDELDTRLASALSHTR